VPRYSEPIELAWRADGQEAAIGPDESRAMDDSLCDCYSNGAEPLAYARVLSKEINRVAEHNDRVGGGVLVSSLPGQAVANSIISGNATYGEGLTPNEAGFVYVPEGESDGSGYGPASACYGLASGGTSWGPEGSRVFRELEAELYPHGRPEEPEPS
jgi:hypothetical protein